MTTAPTRLSHPRGSHPLVLILLGLLLGAAVVIAIVLAVQHDGFRSSRPLEGSGASATQARALPPFSAIDLAGSNEVSVRVGGKQAVIVRGDDNLLRHVTTEVRGNELVIGNSRSFSTRSPMSIEVTVPSLDSLALSGSGILDVEGARGESLAVRLGGSGVLTVGGAVGRLEAGLVGSGELHLGRLVARDVSASVSGSGRIEVHATRSLDASISGSGEITYSGNPRKLSRSITGSGAINQQ
ncbi:MAG: head GIN domain-containing protein [Gaiellaceae bacterium]